MASLVAIYNCALVHHESVMKQTASLHLAPMAEPRLEYDLIVRQQPKAARMCGLGWSETLPLTSLVRQ